jgi:GLPGLI family protein
MSRVFGLIFFMMLLSSFCISQNDNTIIVVYNMIKTPHSLVKEMVLKQTKNQIELSKRQEDSIINELSDTIKMKLIHSQNMSKELVINFEALKKKKNKSFGLIEDVKDFKSKKIYKTMFYTDKKDIEIKESENFRDYKWTINKLRTKKILSYKCYLAIGFIQNIKFEAWFTPDIPVFDGPFDSVGLPGLVLEINTDLLTITATQVDILPENTEIALPKKE